MRAHSASSMLPPHTMAATLRKGRPAACARRCSSLNAGESSAAVATAPAGSTTCPMCAAVSRIAARIWSSVTDSTAGCSRSRRLHGVRPRGCDLMASAMVGSGASAVVGSMMRSPAAKESASRLPAGSAAYTRTPRAAAASAIPVAIPPPLTGTMMASRPSAHWLSSSRARVPCPAMTSGSS
eukprot:scaffold4975_cov112-Isochrysis_galbana.AAC.4